MACEMAYNNLTLTIEMWAPTSLAERFGLSPIQVGTLLAAPQAIRTFGGFAVAALESMLLRRGVGLLQIRRGMTAGAQLPEAACAIGCELIVLSPLHAALMRTHYCLLLTVSLFRWPRVHATGRSALLQWFRRFRATQWLGGVSTQASILGSIKRRNVFHEFLKH